MFKEKSLVVHLSGGLGNQLFQFAAGLSLSELTGKELKINRNLYKNPKFRNRGHPNYLTKRKYEIGDFKDLSNIKIDKALTPRDGRFERAINFLDEGDKRKFGIATEKSFVEGAWVRPEKINRIVGFFMSPKYFTDIRFETRFRELNYALPKSTNDLIESFDQDTTIAVHVRLTDYLSQNDYVVPSEKYYLNSIKYLQEKIGLESKVYVFTDDLKMLEEKYPKMFSIGKCLGQTKQISPAENLLLMSKSSGYVCSNSTYSWWATQLSGVPKNRIVYPSQFFFDSSDSTRSPELWHNDSTAFAPLTGEKIQ